MGDREITVSASEIRSEFNAADRDGDGRITREEWIARYGSDARFDMYDLDSNGYVDAEEFQHVWANDIKFWPFIIADIEYKAQEVFTMVGDDGKLVEGTEEPRDRTLNLVFRGNLW